MIDVNAAVASLNAIFNLLKNAKDTQLAMNIGSEVTNLQGKLMDVQQQALKIQDENRQLRDEIRELKHAAKDENSFQFLHGVYWKTYDSLSLRVDEYGDRSREVRWDDPFCPKCKDADHKNVRLKRTGQTAANKHPVWECEVHGGTYEAPTMQ